MTKVKKRKNKTKATTETEEVLISVCMIVKNEGNNLGNCLQLVNDFADELIVVDTGSEDNTKAIAQRYGARLFHFQWIDDFAAARNESLRHARGKWIIWLDADDRIYPDQHPKILRLAQGTPDKAYHFKLMNDGFEKSQCMQLRMFPNRDEIRFERPVHEQAATSIARLGLSIENSNVVLFHTGYSNPEIVTKKKEKYVRMMSKWLEEHPEDCAIRYQYALALHTLNQDQQANEEFKFLLDRFPENAKNTDPIYYYTAILLGRTYIQLDQYEEALTAFQVAQGIDNNLAFLRISVAEALVHLERYEQAVSHLVEIVDPQQEVSFFPIDYQILQHGRLVLLGKCKLESGDHESAKSDFENAIHLFPQKPDGYKYLAEYQLKTGNYKEAVQHYSFAKDRDPSNFYYDFKIGEMYLTFGWLKKSKYYFHLSLEKAKNHPVVLFHLAKIEQGSGKYEPSLSYFNKLQKSANWNEKYSTLYALLLMDMGDLQSLSNNYNKLLLGKNKQWMSYLLDLYFDHTASFWSRLQDDFPSLHKDDQVNIIAHILQEAVKATNNKDFVLAELQMRVLLFIDKDNTYKHLSKLADIQICNNRLFQSINTLEQGVNFTSSDRDIISILQRLGDCYLHLGIDEAYDVCQQQLKQFSPDLNQPVSTTL